MPSRDVGGTLRDRFDFGLNNEYFSLIVLIII